MPIWPSRSRRHPAVADAALDPIDQPATATSPRWFAAPTRITYGLPGLKSRTTTGGPTRPDLRNPALPRWRAEVPATKVFPKRPAAVECQVAANIDGDSLLIASDLELKGFPVAGHASAAGVAHDALRTDPALHLGHAVGTARDAPRQVLAQALLHAQ